MLSECVLDRDRILMAEQGYDQNEYKRLKVSRYELKKMRNKNTADMKTFIATNISKMIKAGLTTLQIDHKSMLGNQTADFQDHALCICVLVTIGKRTACYPLCFEPVDSTASHETVPILEDVLQV